MGKTIIEPQATPFQVVTLGLPQQLRIQQPPRMPSHRATSSLLLQLTMLASQLCTLLPDQMTSSRPRLPRTISLHLVIQQHLPRTQLLTRTAAWTFSIRKISGEHRYRIITASQRVAMPLVDFQVAQMARLRRVVVLMTCGIKPAYEIIERLLRASLGLYQSEYVSCNSAV
jgi:hypothetical protein